MELHQSPDWGKFMEKIGWREFLVTGKPAEASSRIYLKKIPLLGSIIKIPRPLSPLPYSALEKIARAERALFVKVEPREESEIRALTKNGYNEDHWPLTPTCVIKIDLRPPLEEIQKSFHDDARYSLRKAERNGITVEIIKLSAAADPKKVLEGFYKIFKKTGEKKGFWVPPFREVLAKSQSFGENAYLLLGRFGEPVSGALLLFHQNVAYYNVAASTELGRKLLAQYLVMGETIKLAKARGAETLNLEGIYDPRFAVSRRWKNLTVFKKKFGGEVVCLPGSYTKYYNPLVKLLFKLNR